MATGGGPEDDLDETFLDTIPEEDIGDADAFQKLYWKTNGLYTNFTMKNRTAAAAIKALEASLTLWHSENATLKFNAAEAAYESLCRTLVKAEHVANGDADMTKKVFNRQEAAKRLFDPVMNQYYALVGQQQQLLDNAKKALPAAGAASNPRVFNDSIRPEKLTLETVPHDYRKWKKGIRAFFKINGLDAEDAEVQNMQFATCIDGEIEDLIASELVDAAPVFDDDVGALMLVEKVYSRKHTDTSKRLDLFMSRQKPGESPMAFAARQNLLYQEADLAGLGVDKMRSFFLIAGMTNETLRSKMLEMKDPTHEQLLEKISAWTVAKSASKAIGDSLSEQQKAAVKGMNTPSKKKAGSKDKAGPQLKPPANIKNTPASISGRCGCCGSTAHAKKDCDRASRAKCSTCNMKGHYNNVCLSEYMTWKKKAKKETKETKVSTVGAESGSAPPSEGEEDESS